MPTIFINKKDEEFVEFFNRMGLEITDYAPNILLYTGDNIKELRKLMKQLEADMAFVNNVDLTNDEKFFWVKCFFESSKDILKCKRAWTNSLVLSKKFFSILGAQVILEEVKRPVKEKFILFNINKSLINSIAEYMQWK